MKINRAKDVMKIPRLHRDLAALNLQSKAQKVESDIESASSWCVRFEEYGSRQSGFDVRYVSDRYSKGVDEVEKLMSNSHMILNETSYLACNPEVMKFCLAANGGACSQGLLDII